MVYVFLTLIFWGFADLYYKKANEEKYDHLKTGMIVGFVMGLHATIYLITDNITFDFMALLKYLPVSICYILSMIIGYKGLKYIYLSISSPIQNTSGVITALLLCLIFSITLSVSEIFGIIFILIGILSLFYKGNNKVENIKIGAIIFPVVYALFDGVGTFLDAIYLDELNLISEDMALLSYEYTFLIYGIGCYIYLKLYKREEIKFFYEKNKIIAALLETIGQFTYVYAISSNSVIAIPIISCYSALSIVLSRIFLKEKLSMVQYVSIVVIFIGIILISGI